MVVLPYKDSLLLFSRYLQQLVMESLGKEFDLDGNLVCSTNKCYIHIVLMGKLFLNLNTFSLLYHNFEIKQFEKFFSFKFFPSKLKHI